MIEKCVLDAFISFRIRKIAEIENASKFRVGNHTVSTDTSVNTAFTDASSIAPWAKDAVAFCQTNKLMNGDNHGAFNPKGQIKSVELAQVLYNLSQQIK